MIISMHQPNYIPWLGYFYKIYKSDIFVIADNVQYIKHGYINRNKIKTPQGEKWLTIPVDYKSKLKSNINEVNVRDDLGWRNIHLETIRHNYKKAKYFNHFYEQFKELLLKKHTTISELNISMIKHICKQLEIDTKIVLLSELNVDGRKTENIVNASKAVNADVYLSGHGAKVYNDLEIFKKNNIKLVYSDFKVKKYDQLWGDFLPNMSVVDYIFNCGFDITKVFE